MGKRKKRARSQAAKAPVTDLSHKPFAALAAKRPAAPKDAAERREVRSSGHPETSPPSGAKDTVEMTEDELFRAAVDGIDARQIADGKYLGKGPNTAHVRVREEQRLAPAEMATLGAPRDPYHDDLALFEEAMGLSAVSPIDAKLHTRSAIVQDVQDERANLRDNPQPLDHAARQAAIEAVLATAGPALTPGQRQLLRACAKAERTRPVAEVNVRGDFQRVALRRIELTALHVSAKGGKFMRVITGKGIGSEGEPILKRALVEWCFGDGEGLVVDYAPEVQPDGTFGSFVVQVRRSRRR